MEACGTAHYWGASPARGEGTGGTRRVDARLVGGSPGLGRGTSRAHRIRPNGYRPAGERSSSPPRDRPGCRHMRVCTESGSRPKSSRVRVRLDRRYTFRRDGHRFCGDGPASARGKRTIPVPGRRQQRPAARRHPVGPERARPPPEPRRADLPCPRSGALHRPRAGCAGRGRRRGTVPPADALRPERPTAGAGVVAAVAGGPPGGERRGRSDEAGAGGSGRPPGVLRELPRRLDGPGRHPAGGLLPRLSVREARARPADLAAGPEGARRAAVADQADGGNLRGGRLGHAQAERPPGPGPRAVGAQERRRSRRDPGRVPRLARAVGPGVPASRLARRPAQRFVAGAARRGAGAPGRGGRASRRNDLLLQPEDHGLAQARFGPALRHAGSPAAGRGREAVGAVAIPAIGRVAQRDRSAWRRS